MSSPSPTPSASSTLPLNNGSPNYKSVDTNFISKFSSRDDLKKAQRIIVKIGSAVLARDDESGLALGRMASIVEQVAELKKLGKDVVIVTSGAVALGKQKIMTEMKMSRSMRQTLDTFVSKESEALKLQVRAAAAVGQNSLMSLYEIMFAQYAVKTAQVLITKNDLSNPNSKKNLLFTFDDLLSLHIVPIVNTNDAVVSPAMRDDPNVCENDSGPKQQTIMVHDNDSLAAILAVEMGADLLIILSNVDGVFTSPPGQEGSQLLDTLCVKSENKLRYGDKSSVGTGGMKSKVEAAKWTVDHGVAVVICNGSKQQSLAKILKGTSIGTFFTNFIDNSSDVFHKVSRVKKGSMILQSLTQDQRSKILDEIANMLEKKEEEILTANQQDLLQAKQSNLTQVLRARLKLSPEKLKNLSNGLRSISKQSKGVLGRCIKKTLIADGLVLNQITVPIGVVLVIFESRPDCLPQIAGLCLATGNGIILKGGKEAACSNSCLYDIIQSVLENYGVADAISLIKTREEVNQLIVSENQIDLIIPRGSYELVRNIKQKSGGVPVLGHSEGVCHVYVDKDAELKKLLDIVIESKCDYPAACNAAETILIHSSLVKGTVFKSICDALKSSGVKLFSGPKLSSVLTFPSSSASSLRKEYGDLACTVEIVDDVNQAIEHINTYGSGHTDVIITENAETARIFLQKVDSACCFHNCSSRFADGYRFGLGAEVGISTGKIHARGPVGIEGLISTKWILQGDGHIIQAFEKGESSYKHQELSVTDLKD